MNRLFEIYAWKTWLGLIVSDSLFFCEGDRSISTQSTIIAHLSYIIRCQFSLLPKRKRRCCVAQWDHLRSGQSPSEHTQVKIGGIAAFTHGPRSKLEARRWRDVRRAENVRWRPSCYVTGWVGRHKQRYVIMCINTSYTPMTVTATAQPSLWSGTVDRWCRKQREKW